MDMWNTINAAAVTVTLTLLLIFFAGVALVFGVANYTANTEECTQYTRKDEQ